MTKTFLGDGVYAEYTGYSVILTTENGLTTTNTIHLEHREIESLLEFMTRYKIINIEEQ